MRRLFLSCAAVAIAGGVLSAQPGVFRAGVDVVELDVSVMRGRVPVPGLTVNDFELRDNGIRQNLSSAVLNPQPIRVTMVLDVSASVAGERLENLVRAGRMLADSLKPGEKAALITFSHAVSLRVPMGDPLNDLRESLSRLRARGTTSLRDGVDLALTLESDQRTGSLVLLFSDGADNASWLTGPQVLESARRSSSVIHGVRVGSDPYLGQLADVTGGRTWPVGSDREIEEIFSRILDEMRARYVLTYSPDQAPKRGWHELKVSVKNVRADVTARPGYVVP